MMRVWVGMRVIKVLVCVRVSRVGVRVWVGLGLWLGVGSGLGFQGFWFEKTLTLNLRLKSYP